MGPEIFMDDFEQTIYGDAVYSIIGRALTVATRFEGLCRALNMLLKAKADTVRSEEDIEELVRKMWRSSLREHIRSICSIDSESALKDILNKGRLARNEIAHNLTCGLDRCIDMLPRGHINSLIDRLRELIKNLGEADRAVSLVASIVSHENMPSPHFLKEYPKLIEEWVIMEKEWEYY